MAENTAFSSSGEDIISKAIDVDQEGPQNLSNEELIEYYDIDRTVQEITGSDFKRIALQFPDELLHHSVPVYHEVAAQHVDADAVVHYGHACMSLTSRLPVIYVFGKKYLDPHACVESLLDSMQSSHIEPKVILLRLDVSYAHKTNDVLLELRSRLAPRISVLCNEITNKSLPVNGRRSIAGSSSDTTQNPQITHDMIFFVGGESLTLANILMTNSSCEVHSYDPHTRSARIESMRINKLLMRRYAILQKARDADVFGILVGTLGVASYLPLISHLRTTLSRAHKKSYTISVGKLNPAKLANFPEIECFVLVACPENSVVESKEFLQPIITPYELEIALQKEPNWTGRYELGFEQVLVSQSTNGNENEVSTEEEDLEQPVFSLVTGTYRHAKRYGVKSSNTQDGLSSAVAIRNQDNALSVLPDSAANEFLQSRTFKGLETRLGQDAPSVLEQGQSGIAKAYADDHL
ncbi:hypothetical protein NLI96_g11724 [Meripilus lineatus]|uniref:2-(3-amino-3-carboxypropyl)histidine synthase subunit 2 n=1 Tax=Meripilus lineatus TaxID=2056292 RepID=A0AAD5URD0_9APHY|nr:hypothetical protein NLI96_g11724 [Physisporinus lineatus]